MFASNLTMIVNFEGNLKMGLVKIWLMSNKTYMDKIQL